jgi:outer membrane lipase/esterase
MLKKFLQLAAIGSAIAVGCGVSGTAEAIPFSSVSQVYFFGDSLSDSGFNDLWTIPAPLPVGKAPTFTTFAGYTWSQYIARDVKGFALPVYPGPTPADTITNNAIYAGGTGPSPSQFFVSGLKTGVDYAAGGSLTSSTTGLGETWAPPLTSQISYYLSSHNYQADPNAIYFVWSGANDILTLLNSNTATQLQLLITSQAAAQTIANQVALLAQWGAKRIVVLSLPNIGYTPLIGGAALQTNTPTLPATFKTVTFTFNSMLNSALGQVQHLYPSLKMIYVDVYDLLDNVILATKAGQAFTIGGQSFPFVNYTSPACSLVTTSIYCYNGAPNNYVFADTLHPTNMAHHVLALDVELLIQNWQ